MTELSKIIGNVPTPCYIVDESALIRNLEILKGVRERTGAKILLAQKAFSCYHVYPLVAKYLDGTACSGLFEARLGYEEMGMENPRRKDMRYTTPAPPFQGSVSREKTSVMTTSWE